MSYVLFTESSADMSPELIQELGVTCLPLSFFFGETKMDPNAIPIKEFYDRLRNGDVATTAAVNLEQGIEGMEPVLKAGNDILVVSFSSGLSATSQAMKLAAEELGPKYPERKILVCDTLCASSGQGLIVYLAAQKKKEGMSIDELYSWLEENKLHVCHWFTVDDLMFLKRGGRVSATVAIAGTILGIKPVMHVDDEGHLINVAKARGRKASMQALVNKVEELGIHPETQTIFISHGDCEEDAAWVAEKLKTDLHVPDVRIFPIGPVIGAHSGPGTLAVFFLGTHR